MTPREVSNLPASVHQRLLNRSRLEGRPFNAVLQYYAMERLLYRLSVSRHADSFLLKGALMFQVWRAPVIRHTLDIDLLGRVDNDVKSIASIVRDVCSQPVPPDGMRFDPETVAAEPIVPDADYAGVRVTFTGFLGNARVPMQIDVGTGDFVLGATEIGDYPCLLDFPAPRLRGYSRETTIAEKFQAMIERGRLNTRIKDYFDIWLLSTYFAYQGPTLAESVRKTMARRHTAIPKTAEGLDASYAAQLARRTQWTKFLERNRASDSTPSLYQVVRHVRDFLLPVAEAARADRPFDSRWPPGGPWETRAAER